MSIARVRIPGGRLRSTAKLHEEDEALDRAARAMIANQAAMRLVRRSGGRRICCHSASAARQLFGTDSTKRYELWKKRQRPLEPGRQSVERDLFRQPNALTYLLLLARPS